jgi:redox-sensitive bicupin YhaK (pirin superfamily)
VAPGVVSVHRSAERFHTVLDWLDSRHSFSFADHFDPENTHHGLLLVNNDDVVAPGRGFGRHPHRDMEIVTWVISGELEHRDSAGNHGVIRPGLAQRMSAGTGIQHSEMNPSGTTPVRLIQMWVPPSETGLRPGYEQKEIGDDLDGGGWVSVAAGTGDAVLRIHQPQAALFAARPRPGSPLTLPETSFAHLFVAAGRATLEGIGELSAGDAARLVRADARRLSADVDGTEVLLWTSEIEGRNR